MNREEAKEYAKSMSYRQAVYNALQAKCVPYRKATLMKLHELLDAITEEKKGLIRRDLVLSVLRSPRSQQQMINMVEGLPGVEPCEEAVSREDACHLYCQLTCGKDYCTEPCSDLKIYWDLPSVQTESRWIPVSERLPQSEDKV